MTTSSTIEGRPREARPPDARPPTALRRFACALLLAPALAGCASGPASAPDARGLSPAAAVPLPDRRPLPPEALAADVLLIGELHDNPAQHRLRLHWLDALADQRRFAIALEQLDALRQPDLDRALAADAAAKGRDPLSVRARRIAEAAGFDFKGWDWALYGPVVELALRRDLPLVAANLSRREAMAVSRGQAPAPPEPPGWGAEERRVLEELIRVGHCDALPEKAIAPMAEAQLARDARMAQVVGDVRRRTRLPVVLLAGNGHVRRDIGVPRHLAASLPGERVVSIGLHESGSAVPAAFDRVELTAPAERKDPCEGLRGRLSP